MLTLPALLLALLLCAALAYSIQGAMALDQALAETCGDLAENSYLMMRVSRFGSDLLNDSGLIEKLTGSDALQETGAAQALGGTISQLSRLGGEMLADVRLRSHLKGSPGAAGAVEWRLVRLPEPESGDQWEPGMTFKWEGRLFDEDDVVLALVFTPARLNRVTSLLPDSWQITMIKRQRAWLTGQNHRAQKGEEQAAGKKENGPLVYITNYGVKYHMDGCRYLRKSKYPAYLNQLSDAYGACSVCKPPPRQ